MRLKLGSKTGGVWTKNEALLNKLLKAISDEIQNLAN